MKKYILATAITALMSGAVMAQDVENQEDNQDIRVGLHMFSYHDKKGYNNSNPGLYVKYGSWTFGTYHNSLKKNSTYFGYTFELPLKDKFVDSLDLTVGVITGYPQKIGNTKLSALVAPSARIDLTEKTSLRVIYIPRIKRYNDVNIVHLSFERKF